MDLDVLMLVLAVLGLLMSNVVLTLRVMRHIDAFDDFINAVTSGYNKSVDDSEKEDA